MVTKKINVDLPLDAWYFFEIDCPICRYVLYKIMMPLQTEGYINLRTFEIKANAGTPEVDWFNGYSEWGQEALTPTIRIVDSHIHNLEVRTYPVQILHLWEKKGSILTDADIEAAEILKNHVIESVQKYKRPVFEDFHDKKRYPKIMIQRRMKAYPTGNT